MFPPFSLGGIVDNISDVFGATPITPAKGFNGIFTLSLNVIVLFRLSIS